MNLLEIAHFGSQIEKGACTVISLLHEVAKLFSSRFTAKWGIYTNWIGFLCNEGITDVELIPAFIGHRFNIFFVIASFVFQYRSLLIKFCSQFSKANASLNGIAQRLAVPFICAQLKTLGLLDQLVTGPLCKSGLHVFDLGDEFLALIAWLGANISDSSLFLRGIPSDFANAAFHSRADPALAALVASIPNDPMNDHLPLIV